MQGQTPREWRGGEGHAGEVPVDLQQAGVGSGVVAGLVVQSGQQRLALGRVAAMQDQGGALGGQASPHPGRRPPGPRQGSEGGRWRPSRNRGTGLLRFPADDT
ncbi:hypothetical protein Msi02_28170 [Microbispora siamensis]|uniref:Uncharacterized protein n=1 Tax=Microbispora siamensis TaxID=564413 RepID=A0ABQ4GKP6_9ACTN|nr:hypothetical protein Msi02_28170 [Microbispora siamensis]